jgi:hypothetical protein
VRPLLVYTAARLAVLLVALGVLYALGARGLLLVVLAVVVSGLVSYLAFARQRDAVAARLHARVQDGRARIDARTRAEDEADERARAAEAADGGDASRADGRGPRGPDDESRA